MNYTSWEARQWKCWECMLFLVEQGFSKEPPVVWRDSSSALQLAHRQGTGRLEHVEVRLSAIQSRVSTERLRVQKVRSAENVAC